MFKCKVFYFFLLINILIQTLITTKNIDQKFVVNLEDYNHLQYYGKIYVGSNFQEIEVLVSTGSSQTVIQSLDCTECHSKNKFDYTKSDTFKNTSEYRSINDQVGYISQDTIYIKGIDKLKELQEDTYNLPNEEEIENEKILIDSLSVKRFKFLLINDQNNTNNDNLNEGVIGLGLEHIDNYKSLSKDKYEYSNLIYQFYKQNIISSPRFSLYLSNDSKMGSKLYIGDFSTKTEISNIFHNMEFCEAESKSQQWSCELTSIEINKEITNINSKIIFDSSFQYISIPSSNFGILHKFFSNNKDNECKRDLNNQLICKCESPKDFPEFKLKMINNDIIINPADIVEYRPRSTYQCKFLIINDIDNYDTWILGTPGMRNSLFSFDMLTRKVGWVQNPKDISHYLSKDNIVLEYDDVEGYQKLPYLFAVLFIIVLVIGLFKCANSEKFIIFGRRESLDIDNYEDKKKVELLKNKFNSEEYDYDDSFNKNLLKPTEIKRKDTELHNEPKNEQKKGSRPDSEKNVIPSPNISSKKNKSLTEEELKNTKFVEMKEVFSTDKK